jgi:hypothetical protein
MRSRIVTSIFTLALIAAAGLCAVAFGVSTSVASVSASSAGRREMHVTKECSQYTGTAGSFCTFTSSNLPEITIGSRVYYDQAAGVPNGLLDSNVVLDAGHGNRALGRCTLDLTTHLGVCTFSDGTGNLTAFHARVDVDCRSGCRWDGTYGFGRANVEDR